MPAANPSVLGSWKGRAWKEPLKLLSNRMEDLYCNSCYWYTQVLWSTSFAVLGHIADCMCMCTHVCVYVCMWVCAWVCIYVNVCAWVCMYVNVYVCMSVWVYMYMSVYVNVCVYAYIYTWVCMCVCTCGGQRSPLTVIPQVLSSLFFEKASLVGSELTDWTWLASQWAPGSHLSLPFWCWDSKCVPLYQLNFSHWFWESNSGLYIWLTEPSPWPLGASCTVSWALWEKWSPGSLMQVWCDPCIL